MRGFCQSSGSNSVIEIKYLPYAPTTLPFHRALHSLLFKLVEISLAEILLYRAFVLLLGLESLSRALRLSVSGGAAETWLAWLLGLYSRAI